LRESTGRKESGLKKASKKKILGDGKAAPGEGKGTLPDSN